MISQDVWKELPIRIGSEKIWETKEVENEDKENDWRDLGGEEMYSTCPGDRKR